MHSSQLGESGASEGVSWVGILNFHMVGAGREPWTSVSGKVEVLKTFPDPGWSPAWGAQLRPQQSSSTSRHALPRALLPVGESCYPTMAHSGDHTRLLGTLSALASLWQAGGRVEEVGGTYFVIHPLTPSSAVPKAGAWKAPGWGRGVEM